MPAHPARTWLPALVLLGGVAVVLTRAGAQEPPGQSLRMLEAKVEALEQRVQRLEQVCNRQAQALLAFAAPQYASEPPRESGPPRQADKIVDSSPPGEVHVRPVALPRAQVEKFASDLAASKKLLEDIGGKFIAAEGGIQFQVDELSPASPLADQLGIRLGDRLLSVNGLPVTGNERELQNTWERLRREKRWSLRLVRDGQLVVLNYYLGE